MFRTLILQRKTIVNLAVNDFKRKYAGSYLGVFWAFAQPIITVLVYWFVFQVGFRTTSVGNTPFILWLATGLTPWFFYSDAVSHAMFSFLDYSYLVKKVVFQISILPVVKIVSSLLIHIVFICSSSFYTWHTVTPYHSTRCRSYTTSSAQWRWSHRFPICSVRSSSFSVTSIKSSALSCNLPCG